MRGSSPARTGVDNYNEQGCGMVALAADATSFMDLLTGGMAPAQFWPALGQIMLINLILSGDNAVVIALACRSLPPAQRKVGILLGAGVAVLMRVVFTIGVTSLLTTPWLKVVGSLLLFWIAIKLLAEDGEGEKDIKDSSNIWGAVQTIVVADLVMSLDNVLAIAAAAKGNWSLIIIGLAVSVPLIVFGATMVMFLLTRFPILVWAGAALLGWIAGELIVSDPGLHHQAEELAKALGITLHTLERIAAAIGAAIVVGVGWVLRRRHAAEAH
ncbi:MAG: TerC family protein [Hyphomicrobiaceae bacterium]|nr:TerC family protein [Hyphomicrobiaceae bacterium]